MAEIDHEAFLIEKCRKLHVKRICRRDECTVLSRVPVRPSSWKHLGWGSVFRGSLSTDPQPLQPFGPNICCLRRCGSCCHMAGVLEFCHSAADSLKDGTDPWRWSTAEGAVALASSWWNRWDLNMGLDACENSLGSQRSILAITPRWRWQMLSYCCCCCCSWASARGRMYEDPTMPQNDPHAITEMLLWSCVMNL